MPLSKRALKVLKYIGYTLLALISYIVFLIYTFPVDVIVERGLKQVQAKYGINIQADSIATTLLPPGIEFRNFKLTQPAPNGTRTVKLNVLRLSGPLWSLASDNPAFSYYTKGYGGEAEGSVEYDKKAQILKWKHKAKGINLAQFSAAIGSVSNVPVSGSIGGEWDVVWNYKRPVASNGKLILEGKNLTVGPATKPMPIPKVVLGNFTGKATIADGRIFLQQWKSTGGDIESEVIGTISIRRGFTRPRYNMLYRFKILGNKLKDDSTIKTLLQIIKPALDTDGYYYYRITGSGPSFQVCSKCSKRWKQEQKRYERMLASALKKKKTKSKERGKKKPRGKRRKK